MSINTNFNNGDMCLADSTTTHTILKDKKYFSSLIKRETDVSTISGSSKIIEGSGRANVILCGGTNLKIENALYSPKSHRNLLSFKDIRLNGYHIETRNERDVKYLYITRHNLDKISVVETLHVFSSGLYYTYISAIEAHVIVNKKFTNHNKFDVWHDLLGHPGSIMMRKIIENSGGHQLKSQEILQSDKFSYTSCSQGKLIIRPSPMKIENESLNFLERIHGDIYGPIHPPCRPFRNFMVLIDASIMVTCLFIINSQPGVCEIASSTNSNKSSLP